MKTTPGTIFEKLSLKGDTLSQTLTTLTYNAASKTEFLENGTWGSFEEPFAYKFV